MDEKIKTTPDDVRSILQKGSSGEVISLSTKIIDTWRTLLPSERLGMVNLLSKELQNPGAYISVKEASMQLTISPQKVRDLIKDTAIPALKVGGRWRIPRDALNLLREPSQEPFREPGSRYEELLRWWREPRQSTTPEDAGSK